MAIRGKYINVKGTRVTTAKIITLDNGKPFKNITKKLTTAKHSYDKVLQISETQFFRDANPPIPKSSGTQIFRDAKLPRRKGSETQFFRDANSPRFKFYRDVNIPKHIFSETTAAKRNTKTQQQIFRNDRSKTQQHIFRNDNGNFKIMFRRSPRAAS